jgi:hypothetical protein
MSIMLLSSLASRNVALAGFWGNTDLHSARLSEPVEPNWL